MKMTHRLFAAVLILAASLPARAEETAGVRLGLKVGPCYSAVRWSTPGGSVVDASRKLTFGALAEIDLGPRFAVQPELDLLTMAYTWEPPLLTGVFTDTLQYLQVPVLFKAKLVREGWAVPAVFAGPCLGILFRARERYYDLSTGQSYYADINDLYRDFDLGAAAGAGVDIKVRNLRLIFDVRYYLGLTDVYRAADGSWRNSGLMITGGLGF
jgi:hypothetical protein